MSSDDKDKDQEFRLTLHHWGISVPDLEESIAWYSNMLGFHEERRFDIPQAKARAAIIRHGKLDLELFEVEGATPLPPDRSVPNLDIKTHGIKHVALAVEHRELLLAFLSARGVNVIYGGIKGAFILDNTGNIIELMERD
jgi:methylmalonyl-CoA/ethylmalonyl-CoA epimerase